MWYRVIRYYWLMYRPGWFINVALIQCLLCSCAQKLPSPWIQLCLIFSSEHLGGYAHVSISWLLTMHNVNCCVGIKTERDYTVKGWYCETVEDMRDVTRTNTSVTSRYQNYKNMTVLVFYCTKSTKSTSVAVIEIGVDWNVISPTLTRSA